MQNHGTVIVTKIFVFNDIGEVLLQRSQIASIRPHGWDLPGGIVEDNEDPNNSVLRELKEESSLKAIDTQVFYIGTELEPVHIITLFYKAKTISTDVTLSPEHEKFIWAKPEAILDFQMPQKFVDAVHILSETETYLQ